MDREERGRAYRQLQEIVAEELPYVGIVETVATRAYDASCTGFKAYTGHFAETAFCRR